MANLILAFDSFKGCLTSQQANEAAADGIRLVLPDAELTMLQMSDGGEGWIDAMMQASDAHSVVVNTTDALFRPITARYAVTADSRTAFIELAQASGLTSIAAHERDPMTASTYGTGVLIRHAIDAGCRTIIIGLGGSATSDCGIGLLQALGLRLLNSQQQELPPTAESVSLASTLDITPLTALRHKVRFVAASDVTAPLLGPTGAARVFAPQKGATPEQVELIEHRNRHLVSLIDKALSDMHTSEGASMADTPGAGAAGGTAFALKSLLGADIRPGAQILLDAYDFDRRCSQADCIITGEGKSDSQTLLGKLPYCIMKRAEAGKTPTLLYSGQVTNREQLLQAGFSEAVAVTPPQTPEATALNPDFARRQIISAIQSTLLQLLT
ncbi:MAG: glycerate kinase [Paludibacteraceae bacterium]|nr:glycerate kinase [Paludibacteraceae bacterium]